MSERIDFKADDPTMVDFLLSTPFFNGLEREQMEKFAAHLYREKYSAGEYVYQQGEKAKCAYVVEKGIFAYEMFGRITTTFDKGELFGLLPLFEEKNVKGILKALEESVVICIEYDLITRDDILSSKAMLSIYREFSKHIATYLQEEADLYRFMDVLIIEDGGCAPGKNPIIAFLTEALEKAGRQVFITAEGYRSLVSGKDEDFRCLINNPKIFNLFDHIPGVIFTPPLRDARGANFRSERFPEFREVANQKKAVENALSRHVKIVIGVGGNGTFGGLKAFASHLPDHVQVFFVPVTIDSDVHGTETIGQHTGVEAGSEKVRCYMADARTHHRCYIVEMMGAMGGFHALNSCIGAGAHLAVLPGLEYDIPRIAKALEEKESAVIVVAEGYRKEERKEKNFCGNAAEYFRDMLLAAGLKTRMKIYCEPFSRDIRGASPNNIDIALTQRMAKKVVELASQGRSRVMPAIRGIQTSSIPFEEITTDNSVGEELAKIANRLY
ncbi:MAG: 6-phosphofructokinase [Candidatus Eremiobacteraeota bacterium]|nr:6-phosphofructokinase [Candidatus Eremiobacteraeota bacterium]